MKKLMWMLLLAVSTYAKVYQSYFPYETDTVVAAWLIHRYVDSNATFVSYPKGTKIDAHKALNTSQSKFRRNARFTAYEMVKRYYGIADTCSDSLVKVVRVLEMMPWKKHEFNEIEQFENGLVVLLPQKTGKADLRKAFSYIDRFCEEHR